MRDELAARLQEEFPELYGDPKKFGGFAVGDGWFGILWSLGETLTEELRSTRSYLHHLEGIEGTSPKVIDELRREVEEAEEQLPLPTQIKEKFGGLRFYCDAYTDFARGAIHLAEELSLRTCEYCGNGSSARLRTTRPWMRTLCEYCALEQGYSTPTEAPDDGR